MQRTDGGPVASVVVPAHNEQSVILRCLETLLTNAREGEFEVVVAANGCTDATVQLVRESGLDVRCLDLPVPGKINALNSADAACTVFPRIYLDADVLLGADAARSLAVSLRDGPAMAGSPRMVVDTRSCSAVVRAYYRIWTRLDVFGEGYVGSGVYGLSRPGHARVAPFPAVTNDDDYVRRSFSRDERCTTSGSFTVFPARNVTALVRRGARTRAGNLELDGTAVAPANAGPGTEKRSAGSAALSLARDPRNWPDLVLFCLVTLRVRRAAARRRDSDAGWGRDDTSRSSGAGTERQQLPSDRAMSSSEGPRAS
ncbi:glycosyltransferase [Nocardioides flavescens]|uniref:4,4'-diaponeurosporenoate glycosyltransferase n=1 Tax=Nocardioides flavescens TaxID=2691959 RepID=A0A6L7EZV9_9ACTN|nr:glycosyltransferase [Nocardioides flavescens]